MNFKISLLVLAVAIAFSSCKKDHLDSGDLTTEIREVGDFSKLVVEGSFDVIITQDDAFDVKIQAGEKKMRYIKTTVSGHTLRIYESNNHIENDHREIIYVSADYLTRIALEGSGDINGTGIISENIDLIVDGSGDISLDMDIEESTLCHIDGSGDILITGQAFELNGEVHGSGTIIARNYEVNDAFLLIEGSGDISVNALENLFVDIHGSGDVYYVENQMNLTVHIDGSGSIGPL